MIVVAGENVVDLLPQPDGSLRPTLGGGPANVSVAAARLGARVAMAARLSGDVFGGRFRQRLTEAGVDPTYLRDCADPSTLALVTIDTDGTARFDFWLSGTADFGWRDDALPQLAPGDVLHLGSLTAFIGPGADALERWAVRHREIGTVTLDPNLRPIALAMPDAVARLERLVALAHVVKVSEDDLLMAYPGRSPDETARSWRAEFAPELIVVTRGADGATGFTADGETTVPAPVVSIVDTIGAGDAGMAAVLTCLDRGTPVDLAYVCAVASLACTKPGADAPTAAEVSAFQARSPATPR